MPLEPLPPGAGFPCACWLGTLTGRGPARTAGILRLAAPLCRVLRGVGQNLVAVCSGVLGPVLEASACPEHGLLHPTPPRPSQRIKAEKAEITRFFQKPKTPQAPKVSRASLPCFSCLRLPPC